MQICKKLINKGQIPLHCTAVQTFCIHASAHLKALVAVKLQEMLDARKPSACVLSPFSLRYIFSSMQYISPSALSLTVNQFQIFTFTNIQCLICCLSSPSEHEFQHQWISSPGVRFQIPNLQSMCLACSAHSLMSRMQADYKLLIYSVRFTFFLRSL